MGRRVIIGEQENATELAIALEDTLVLRLTENAAAGYRWTVTSIESFKLEIATEAYEPADAGIGSAGATVWTFRPRNSGRTRLELKKVRSWSPGDPAADTFAITLTIGGQ